MRQLLSLLTAFLFAAQLHAQGDTVTISRIFAQESGQSSVAVLRLYENNKYQYCRYTKKKISRDEGRFELKKGKLQLTTEMKKHGYNPLLNKTLYVSKTGLHRSRLDAWTGRNSTMELSDDESYRKNWSYNPITRTDENAAPKPIPVPVAQKNSNGDNSSAAPAVDPAVRQAAGEFARNYYIKIAGTYAKGYDDVLRKNYCGPDCYHTMINGVPVEWNADTSSGSLFGDMETVIHESVHQYNGSRSYLVVPGITIESPSSPTYRSEEFSAIVPAEAIGKIFRYETYVGKGSYVSANQSGIFGLMDEYSAYCNGVRFCLVSARTALAKKDTAMAKAFIRQATGTYFAHYEFRLFTAWYLHYASQEYPDQYAELQKNQNLRVTFTLLDDEFRQTILDLNSLDKTMKGSSWSFSKEYYDKKYTDVCAQELQKEEVWLTKFKVAGVNKDNYQTFLKD